MNLIFGRGVAIEKLPGRLEAQSSRPRARDHGLISQTHSKKPLTHASGTRSKRGVNPNGSSKQVRVAPRALVCSGLRGTAHKLTSDPIQRPGGG